MSKNNRFLFLFKNLGDHFFGNIFIELQFSEILFPKIMPNSQNTTTSLAYVQFKPKI